MMPQFGLRELGVPVSLLMLLNSSYYGALAQTDSSTGTYTVYSTFIYARSGEHTPTLGLQDEEIDTTQLTAFGANQLYNAGNFYRQRYIGTGTQASHRIPLLEPYLLDDLQITVQSPVQDYSVKSAQAFMQGFYPPVMNQDINATSAEQSASRRESFNTMADGTYTDTPLGGYQYPLIQTSSAWSPESIFISGHDQCTNGAIGRMDFLYNQDYQRMVSMTKPLYRAVSPLFQGTKALPLGANWTYNSANSIYEYLMFENQHNATVNAAFKSGGYYSGMLPAFADLASTKMWDFYGDQSITAGGSAPRDTVLAMGGRTLAAKVVAQLESNINNLGIINKLNLVTGEFQNMISLFSLMGLGDFSSQFKTVPPYGSSLAFEVFTYQSGNNTPEIPNPSDLWVRFLFRNASDPMSSDPAVNMPSLQAYPIFHRGPSGTDMPWLDFKTAMANISTQYLNDYCTICNADTLYCYPFTNPSRTSISYVKGRKSAVSPAVAGVIGAVVTLFSAGLLFAVVAFFGGIRFHRKENTKKSLGGFKGSNKMASDADLNLPRNAADPAGLSFAPGAPKKGHERVGSWELKPAEKDQTSFGAHARFASIASTIVARSSFDDDDDHDGDLTAPVSPRESV